MEASQLCVFPGLPPSMNVRSVCFYETFRGWKDR